MCPLGLQFREKWAVLHKDKIHCHGTKAPGIFISSYSELNVIESWIFVFPFTPSVRWARSNLTLYLCASWVCMSLFHHLCSKRKLRRIISLVTFKKKIYLTITLPPQHTAWCSEAHQWASCWITQAHNSVRVIKSQQSPETFTASLNFSHKWAFLSFVIVIFVCQ